MKNLLWIVPLVIHFAFLGQNIFRSFVKIDKLKMEQEIKIKQKKEIESLIVRYDEMIENINNPFYREKVARNQLQMVLPGEKIYRLIGNKVGGKMKRELALEFARVTEAAALAAYKWVGRGDKEAADQAAVDAMRTVLNGIKNSREIVIGEGEIDEAPMLYIGEKVGIDSPDKERYSQVDIAVDPVEGTRMTAQGQANAIAVLAVGEQRQLLKAPDMYMEKLIVGPEAKGVIDLSKPLMENIDNICKALNKPLNELTVVVLDKPRHKTIIKDLQDLNIKVYALPDGDVAGSILTSVVDSDVDVLYGIGGAPEGVISAAVIKALGGDMQARLKLRSEVKGVSLENDKISAYEKSRCEEMGLRVGDVLKMDDLVKDDEVIFSATGITSGDLLEGVKRKGNIARTQTLVIRGKSKTVRYINAVHNLDYKPEDIMELVK